MADDNADIPPIPDASLVPVFKTDQRGLLDLATIELDEASIEYTVRDATELDIVTGGGVRRVSPGTEVARVIFVADADRSRARDLLVDLENAPPGSIAPADATMEWTEAADSDSENSNDD